MPQSRRRLLRPGMRMPGARPMQAMPAAVQPRGQGIIRRPNQAWWREHAAARGRRGATPAQFARARRGAMPAELMARGGFTRDRADTGGMRMKPPEPLSGLSRVPVIGWFFRLFEGLRNWAFRGEEKIIVEKQGVGLAGRKGRLVPIQGPEMTPQDILDLTHGTGKFAQGRARQGAARQGAARRAAAMRQAQGQRRAKTA